MNIGYLKPIHCIINESVTCKPLCRTYAIFKKEDIWFKDLKNKVVTNDELRYIIPMDSENGLIMISYTDDIYTKYWKAIKNNQNKLKNKIVEHVKMFLTLISTSQKKYLFLIGIGVTYWNKNINSEEVSDFLINPLPNTYICGENYSLNQSWVEGALESVNSCLKK